MREIAQDFKTDLRFQANAVLASVARLGAKPQIGLLLSRDIFFLMMYCQCKSSTVSTFLMLFQCSFKEYSVEYQLILIQNLIRFRHVYQGVHSHNFPQ